MAVFRFIESYLKRLSLKVLILPTALLAVLLLWVTSVTDSFDQSVRALRNQVYSKQASGDLVIVEMDAKSLQEIGQWPWPRTKHAKLIEKLSAAGASQIALDIDFSSASTAEADKALANSISESKANIILATFKQAGSDTDSFFRENLPLLAFTQNAMLASVNVHPNSNGQIEYYDYAEVTDNTVRPTLAALIAGSSGATKKSFRIDQAIDPATIPRASVIDVIEGRFNTQLFAGKTVVVGASAIELGDQYSTPEHGIIPGVVIHGLAAETLKSGSDILILDGVVLLFAIIILLFLGKLTLRAKGQKYLNICVPPILATAMVITSYVAYDLKLFDMAVGLSLGFLLSYMITAIIFLSVSSAYHARMSDRDSGLPNGTVLIQEAARQKLDRIAAVNISNFSEIKALLKASEIGPLMKKMADRIGLAAHGQRVFHIGNDQLAWIVPADYIGRLPEYFDTISTLFQSPFDISERKIRLQAYCGYAEGYSDSIQQLVSDASMAAHRATAIGFRWVQYSDDMSAIADEKLTILTDVDAAIEDRDIWVAYQPKMKIASGVVTSMEALARWAHPKLGRIAPDRFIPLLEQEGRMADLTLHILRKSIEDLERWTTSGSRLNCSINISLLLLEDKGFVAEAVALVSDGHIDNSQITFEITETASSENLEEAGRVLSGIRKTGIRVSIDDYGTGQSTLSYLRGFPADEIKIDQIFVKSMLNNDLDRVMVGSTIELAHQMQFEVVAEGVEDAATMQMVKEFGCDIAQGWHIGKPVDAKEFEAQWLLLDDDNQVYNRELD